MAQFNYSKNLKVERFNFGKEFTYVTLEEFEEFFFVDERIVNGHIVKQLFYEKEDFTSLIIEVDFEYDIDETTGMVSKIDKDLHFIEEDGSIGWTKPVVDKLTTRRKLSLLKKRRKTVRENIEASVLQFLQASGTRTENEVLQIGVGFVLEHKKELDEYEAVGYQKIVADIATAADDWLDETPSVLGGATIRQYMMAALSA